MAARSPQWRILAGRSPARCTEWYRSTLSFPR
uniref:Uncharacterized protein n=1 Tax=Arundo donax TaxID=35708 RepID=A0A0A8Z533_ARUDO